MLKIDNTTAINLSIRIIESYCSKKLSWIADHMDDRTFFIGPREGQIIRNRTDIRNAWISDLPMPDFTVSNIEASCVTINSSACEVLLHYYVYWHKEDGSVMSHPQIMQVSWVLRQKPHDSRSDSFTQDQYKIAMMHISNPEKLDERDLVFNTFGDIATSGIGRSRHSSDKSDRWIIIWGVGAVMNRYPAGSILWAESTRQGHQSIVHTRDRNIRSSKPIGWFMNEYPSIFLRPSASFIINPAFVKTVQRFRIELWDGTVLRVPEKKYSQFKKEFSKYDH